MKKRLLLIFLAITFHFLSDAQCTVSISAADSLICAGDTAALTAFTVGEGHELDGSNIGGNNQRGNMFDIVATNAVTIFGFDVSPMGNTTIEIYYKAGTWNGFANTPSAWTYVGSAPVVYTGGFVSVAFPMNITIPAGQTYGFYITSNSTFTSLNYSNGNAVGNVYSSDANITFLEGGGLDYPFTQGTGAVYQPRVWNGRIHYAVSIPASTTYLWGQGQTTGQISQPLTSATTYTVESTVPGCPTMYDTLTINVSTPYVNAGSNVSVCAGDSVTLTATGSATYSWDPVITNGQTFLPLASANYVVTGTDTAGCVAMDTAFVEVFPLPGVSAGADQTICQGASLTLSATGADTYVWNHGVTNGVPFEPIATNTYTVVGTDVQGCQNTDSVTITVYPFTTDITVSGEIILIGNPWSGVTYQWINCSTNQVIAGETGQAYLATENGSYAVIISNGQCTDTTDCVTVSTVGLGENSLDNLVSVYPNPSNGTFVIRAAANSDLEITDLNGRLVKKIHLNNAQTEIELFETNGIYLVKWIKEGRSVVKRIVIQKN